jgi:hypothetical protein
MRRVGGWEHHTTHTTPLVSKGQDGTCRGGKVNRERNRCEREGHVMGAHWRMEAPPTCSCSFSSGVHRLSDAGSLPLRGPRHPARDQGFLNFTKRREPTCTTSSTWQAVRTAATAAASSVCSCRPVVPRGTRGGSHNEGAHARIGKRRPKKTGRSRLAPGHAPHTHALGLALRSPACPRPHPQCPQWPHSHRC